MGKALLIVVPLVLLVYAFFDLYATPRHTVQHLPKSVWFAVVLIPFVGPLLWLFTGSSRSQLPPPGRSSSARAVGPDDDPDFLRGL
jgi:hypothetical protein